MIYQSSCQTICLYLYKYILSYIFYSLVARLRIYITHFRNFSLIVTIVEAMGTRLLNNKPGRCQEAVGRIITPARITRLVKNSHFRQKFVIKCFKLQVLQFWRVISSGLTFCDIFQKIFQKKPCNIKMARYRFIKKSCFRRNRNLKNKKRTRGIIKREG